MVAEKASHRRKHTHRALPIPWERFCGPRLLNGTTGRETTLSSAQVREKEEIDKIKGRAFKKIEER